MNVYREFLVIDKSPKAMSPMMASGISRRWRCEVAGIQGVQQTTMRIDTDFLLPLKAETLH